MLLILGEGGGSMINIEEINMEATDTVDPGGGGGQIND